MSNSLCASIGHDWRSTTADNYRVCVREKCKAAVRYHYGVWIETAEKKRAKVKAATAQMKLFEV